MFNDVLRLSEVWPLILSGLNLGGKTDRWWRLLKKQKLNEKFGEYVNKLGAHILLQKMWDEYKRYRYVWNDKHVTGIPESMGGSGDPSPVKLWCILGNESHKI